MDEVAELRARNAELERRLSERDARYDSIARVVDSIDSHLYINEVLPDGQRRTLFAGPGRDRLLGGTPADGDWGRAWIDAIHEDDRALYALHTARYKRGEPSEVCCRLVGLDGVTRWIRGGGQPRWEGDRLIVEGIVREATAEVMAEQLLREASLTDALTGIANRRRFGEELEAELARSRVEGLRPGLLLLDVDHFKGVNDTWGHRAGDAILVALAARLQTALRPFDTLARWGGEEFIILLPAIPGELRLRAIAEDLRRAIADGPFLLHDGRQIRVTISIGAVHVQPDEAPEVLVDHADHALYSAKRLGRDFVRFFSDLTDADAAAEEPLALRLAQALSVAASVREGVGETHSEQVASLAGDIASLLELPDDIVLRCRIGGWLHDIGKAAIPDAVLGKPGPLDEDQWSIMRGHPEIGERIISRIEGVGVAAAAVRHHHERFDGGGYPDGLVGEAIPIEARIVAVSDAFCALTSDRVYARARGTQESLAALRASAGLHHDPVVVDALAEAVARRVAAATQRLQRQAA